MKVARKSLHRSKNGKLWKKSYAVFSFFVLFAGFALKCVFNRLVIGVCELVCEL